MTKQKILNALGVKEYWLTEDEQKLIDMFRESKWKSPAQDQDKTHQCANSSNNKSDIEGAMKMQVIF